MSYEGKRRQLWKIMTKWKSQEDWEVEEADWNDTEKGREYKNYWFYKRPKGINIDITHRCPLECSSCQRQTEFLNHGKKVHGYDLDLSDIEKLAKYYHQFSFCGQFSDPVHHPKFIEILKILRRYGCKASIHNASTFKSMKWYIEAFKAYPENTQWIFAIDGLPEESHKYRINQDGPKMFQILLEAKKHLHMTPSWQFIIFSYNEHNVDKAKQMAFDNGLGFIEIQSSRWLGQDDPLMPKSQKYKLDSKKLEISKGKFEDVDIKGPIKLMPRCMIKDKATSQQAAVSNRGHLIPCCWVDNAKTMTFNGKNRIMKGLLKVSKINEVEDIEQIVFSKEWQEFGKNLRERNMDKILHCCKHHCRLREDKDKLKISTYYGKTGGVKNKNIIG